MNPRDQQPGQRIAARAVRGLAREADAGRLALGSASFLRLGGGTGETPAPESWFPATVTEVSGSGNAATYGWQPEWLDATGNISVNAGAASGNTTLLPGVCVTGAGLQVGDWVLARPGPGAGGTRYELAPLGGGNLTYPVLANITSVAYYPAFGTDGTTVWVGYYTAAAQQVTNDYVLANAAPPRNFSNVLAAWPSYFASGDTVAVFPVQGYGGEGNEAFYAMPACTYCPRVTIFVADDGEGGVGTVYDATPADEVILVNANIAAAEVLLFQPYEINTRKRYTVKKTDPSSNAVTIVGGGFAIDGASSLTLANQYDFATVIGDGNTSGPLWHIVAKNP